MSPIESHYGEIAMRTFTSSTQASVNAQAAQTAFAISPYSVEYMKGLYVVLYLLTPVSCHKTLRAAENAIVELNTGALVC